MSQQALLKPNQHRHLETVGPLPDVAHVSGEWVDGA